MIVKRGVTDEVHAVRGDETGALNAENACLACLLSQNSDGRLAALTGCLYKGRVFAIVKYVTRLYSQGRPVQDTQNRDVI